MTGSRFDRCYLERTDAAWIGGLRASRNARYVLFHGERLEVVIDPEQNRPAIAHHDQLPEGVESESGVFLGRIGDHHYFSLHLAERREDCPPVANLRQVAADLDAGWLEMLSMGRALLAWRELHRFCGRCGAPTRPRASGQALVCSSGECGREIFPRVDPAIIVMVTHGERALLVNKPQWPESRRSVIAGFVDAGETLEDAVRREVHEESGVRVGAVHYVCSQPWPFPGSLMLACRAEATTTDIDTSHEDELRLAGWYTRDEIRAGVDAGRFTLPDAHAVSRVLIDSWLGE